MTGSNPLTRCGRLLSHKRRRGRCLGKHLFTATRGSGFCSHSIFFFYLLYAFLWPLNYFFPLFVFRFLFFISFLFAIWHFCQWHTSLTLSYHFYLSINIFCLINQLKPLSDSDIRTLLLTHKTHTSKQFQLSALKTFAASCRVGSYASLPTPQCTLVRI